MGTKVAPNPWLSVKHACGVTNCYANYLSILRIEIQQKSYVYGLSCLLSAIIYGGLAEWLRRSVLNLVRSPCVGSNPRRWNYEPQANSRLSCPSFRGG